MLPATRITCTHPPLDTVSSSSLPPNHRTTISSTPTHFHSLTPIQTAQHNTPSSSMSLHVYRIKWFDTRTNMHSVIPITLARPRAGKHQKAYTDSQHRKSQRPKGAKNEDQPQSTHLTPSAATDGTNDSDTNDFDVYSPLDDISVSESDALSLKPTSLHGTQMHFRITPIHFTNERLQQLEVARMARGPNTVTHLAPVQCQRVTL